VRQLALSLGYHFRLNVRWLPGRPDLVFGSRRKVIFVHGCFWHRHRCEAGRSMPASNVAYWRGKFQGNQRRDARVRRLLMRKGWDVLVVWECELRRPGFVRERLKQFLRFRSHASPASRVF
jgi:DNA mismatch endonuclease, patch repair protein